MSDDVAAELAIRRTLAAYCQTCDDGRFDEFAACFAGDATMTALGQTVRGRDAIRDWITAAMPPSRRGKHVCVNAVITITGDVARSDSDFLFLAPGRDGPVVTTAGRYADELERDGDRWVFTRREITLLAPSGGG